MISGYFCFVIYVELQGKILIWRSKIILGISIKIRLLLYHTKLEHYSIDFHLNAFTPQNSHHASLKNFYVCIRRTQNKKKTKISLLTFLSFVLSSIFLLFSLHGGTSGNFERFDCDMFHTIPRELSHIIHAERSINFLKCIPWKSRSRRK